MTPGSHSHHQADPPMWRVRDGFLSLMTPRVMGILNVTPDSFSDGGQYDRPERALEHARVMAEQGADIIDIGGESTRPGSQPVDAVEEQRRVLPVIKALAGTTSALLSVDTTKAAVAEAALAAGAHIVNDVSAGRADPALPAVAARYRAGLVLMHMQGTPATMQERPVYDDVVGEVAAFLAERVAVAVAAGVAREAIVVDPGIGFGKTLDHNLALLRGLPEVAKATGCPVLIGVSRKRFVGAITGRDTPDRLAGSLAAAAFAIQRGARIIRVHDVKESCDVARMMARLSCPEGNG